MLLQGQDLVALLTQVHFAIEKPLALTLPPFHHVILQILQRLELPVLSRLVHPRLVTLLFHPRDRHPINLRRTILHRLDDPNSLIFIQPGHNIP